MVVRSLHVKMGHPDSATMAQMFAKRFSGRSQKPVIEVLKKFKCDLCERRKAMPRRPRTALPREPLFNHTVGMDVWFLRQHPDLHICCLFSRYSQGAVPQSKEAVNVSRAFLDKWIKCFGVPGVVLTDLGGEFENDVIRTMADRYGIELKSALSECLFFFDGHKIVILVSICGGDIGEVTHTPHFCKIKSTKVPECTQCTMEVTRYTASKGQIQIHF